MSGYLNKINSLIGAEEVKKEILKWQSLSMLNLPKQKKIIPNYLLSIDNGCGFSTIAQLMAEALKELKLFNFASATAFLELKFEDNAQLLFEEIRSEAIISNEFWGVVAIDISTWVEDYHSEQFEEFLQYVRLNNNNIVFIFRIPNISDHMARKLLGALKVAGNIRHLIVPAVKDSELIGFIRRILDTESISVENDAYELLNVMIVELKERNDFEGYKTVLQLIADIIYEIGTDSNFEFLNTKRIIYDSLQKYYKEIFKNKLISTTKITKLGF